MWQSGRMRVVSMPSVAPPMQDARGSQPRRALLAGATGLVGRELLRHLSADPRYAEVHVLARRPLSDPPAAAQDHRRARPAGRCQQRAGGRRRVHRAGHDDPRRRFAGRLPPRRPRPRRPPRAAGAQCGSNPPGGGVGARRRPAIARVLQPRQGRDGSGGRRARLRARGDRAAFAAARRPGQPVAAIPARRTRRADAAGAAGPLAAVGVATGQRTGGGARPDRVAAPARQRHSRARVQGAGPTHER